MTFAVAALPITLPDPPDTRLGVPGMPPEPGSAMDPDPEPGKGVEGTEWAISRLSDLTIGSNGCFSLSLLSTQ